MATNGRVIILTGASRGIGLAIAHCLLGQQCKLVVTARTQSALEKLQSEFPGQVECLVGDMTDLSVGSKAVELATSRWGRLDGVVVNHGVLDPISCIANANMDEWKMAYDVNFFSSVAIAKAALPALRFSKGRIIFTTSGAATRAFSGWGSYASAKAAINNFALILSAEEPDIVAIAVRPGTVDTEMQRDIREKHILNGSMNDKDVIRFAKLPANGRLLRPEQPGNVIARLVMDAPIELSGKNLAWNSEELARFQD